MNNLNNLEQQIKSLEEETLSLKGKCKLLEEQFVSSQNKLKELKELQEINQKAIELLTCVSKATREKIKELFESVVTKALQFIHQSNNYNFELEFDRHGNTPKMTFLIKTPDMQESHDLMTTRAGGSKDIVALALRFVLLEISKIPGFIFLDEPAKRLDNPETITKMIEFIQEMQQKTGRQILIITHKQEMVDSIANPIILRNKCPVSGGHSDKVDKPKKRGRPKGSKNKRSKND
ncbi:MAG: hypothetical protein PVG65_00145 [Candidatus Thorarchaeota archaeon]|jgi:DNA repair exonuclease SbcCD ATPase subunit